MLADITSQTFGRKAPAMQIDVDIATSMMLLADAIYHGLLVLSLAILLSAWLKRSTRTKYHSSTQTIHFSPKLQSTLTNLVEQLGWLLSDSYVLELSEDSRQATEAEDGKVSESKDSIRLECPQCDTEIQIATRAMFLNSPTFWCRMCRTDYSRSEWLEIKGKT